MTVAANTLVVHSDAVVALSHQAKHERQWRAWQALTQEQHGQNSHVRNNATGPEQLWAITQSLNARTTVIRRRCLITLFRVPPGTARPCIGFGGIMVVAVLTRPFDSSAVLRGYVATNRLTQG